MYKGRLRSAWALNPAVILVALLGPGWGARAQPRTLYESERVAAALERKALAPDPRPHGKRVAFIVVEREEVFLDQELQVPILLPKRAPTWPNKFHWLTREGVVRRELLVSVGDLYDARRVQESARNLRALGIFALVRIVAVRAAEPNSVGLFVYTRDLWSLRLETAFSGTTDALHLSTALTERNLFGSNKQLSARFGLDPKAFSVGEYYIDPRLARSDLALNESFDVIFNRATSEPEGSRGSVSIGEPLRTLEQSWSFGVTASYAVFVARSLRGSEVVGFRPDGEGRIEVCEAPSPECLRAVWDDSSQYIGASGTFHRGRGYRQSFTAGLAYSDREVSANRETGLQSDQRELFAEHLLPRTRRQVYPLLSYGLFVPQFVVFHNLATFGQSESIRTGPEAVANVAFPIEAFGSTTDSVTFGSGAGYVLAGFDALAEALVSASARLEENQVRDQGLRLMMRGATPQWLLGRLIVKVDWELSRRDTARSQVTLGADTGLRGYTSGAFRVVGGNRLRGNLEYRTLPLVIASVHVGAVLFYDAGSVYRALDAAALHHAAGGGIRLLFPQLNRTPFRADLGVPIDRSGFVLLFSYGSEQAVPVTAVETAP